MHALQEYQLALSQRNELLKSIRDKRTNADYPNDKPEIETELLVEKARDGITGDIKMRFIKEYTKFVEIENREDRQ